MPNYVSAELNRICTEAGIQCCVTMDVGDYKKIFDFRNLSKHDVQISMGKQTYVVPAGVSFVFKSLDGKEPKITKWFVFYRSPLPANSLAQFAREMML
jgi:hypothetical protein